MKHSTLNKEPRSPIAKKHLRQWARAWFASDAYCPACRDTDLLVVVDSSTEESRIETWSCGRCRQRWKVELREVAIAFVHHELDCDHDWIERDELAPLSPVSPRAVIESFLRASLAKAAGIAKGWRHAGAKHITPSHLGARALTIRAPFSVEKRKQITLQVMAKLYAKQHRNPEEFLKRVMGYAFSGVEHLTDSQLLTECHRWNIDVVALLAEKTSTEGQS